MHLVSQNVASHLTRSNGASPFVSMKSVRERERRTSRRASVSLTHARNALSLTSRSITSLSHHEITPESRTAVAAAAAAVRWSQKREREGRAAFTAFLDSLSLSPSPPSVLSPVAPLRDFALRGSERASALTERASAPPSTAAALMPHAALPRSSCRNQS